MILLYIVLAIFSSWVIAKACDGFEDAADYLGRNMKDGMKGATFNAIGSSIPELAVTAIYLFLFNDTTGFAGGIGTTAGSAVFNAMVIPSLVIFYVLIHMNKSGVGVSKKVILRDGLVLLSAEAVLIFFLGATLEWYHGLLLMVIYISYASFMIFKHNSGVDGDGLLPVPEIEDEEEDEEEIEDTFINRIKSLFKLDLSFAVLGNKDLSTLNAYLLLFVSTIFVSLASWVLVVAAEGISSAIHIHAYFVAVIIVAAASSVPDTILSLKDAKKGDYDDAIANALGSNIFDICFALGLPLFAWTLINGPIHIATDSLTHINELRVMLFILTGLTFLLMLFSKKLTKTTALVMFSFYLVFVTYIVGRAWNLEFIQPVTNKIDMIIDLISRVV